MADILLLLCYSLLLLAVTCQLWVSRFLYCFINQCFVLALLLFGLLIIWICEHYGPSLKPILKVILLIMMMTAACDATPQTSAVTSFVEGPLRPETPQMFISKFLTRRQLSVTFSCPALFPTDWASKWLIFWDLGGLWREKRPPTHSAKRNFPENGLSNFFSPS